MLECDNISPNWGGRGGGNIVNSFVIEDNVDTFGWPSLGRSLFDL